MTATGRVGLYWRTLRHLRPRQAWNQARRLILPASGLAPARGRWDGAAGSAVVASLAALGPVDAPPRAREVATAWADGRLAWLGLDIPWIGDWRMSGPSPLWRYHLHYHEHLADAAWLAADRQDPALARRVLDDIRAWQHAWAQGGAPAWDAYPVAVRLVSWLRVLGATTGLLPAEELQSVHEGIALHTEHLAKHLEWHLEGNHILRDAWALALGAACLTQSPVRRQDARALFESLMLEQVHPDGWHEERSPMYHARALRDALEVQAAYAAIGYPLAPEVSARIDAMREALRWMLRANGELWQLNDSALDLGVHLPPLLPPGAGLIDGHRWFRDAETVVLADHQGDRLRLDLGGPAPAHQPGHAHAGALGFELDIEGLPLVIDGGVAGYDGDPWRPWLRGTASHSTVCVDGMDQNENWATFRIGARAQVQTERVEGSSDHFSAVATCRPYHSDVEHRREFVRAGRQVQVIDVVERAHGRTVEGFTHFAPEWSVSATAERTFRLRRGGVNVLVRIEGDAEVTLHRGDRTPILGWRARGFNDVVPAFAIRVRFSAYSGATWRTIIEPD